VQVREARLGNSAGLLRRCASRNDNQGGADQGPAQRENASGRWCELRSS